MPVFNYCRYIKNTSYSFQNNKTAFYTVCTKVIASSQNFIMSFNQSIEMRFRSRSLNSHVYCVPLYLDYTLPPGGCINEYWA